MVQLPPLRILYTVDKGGSSGIADSSPQLASPENLMKLGESQLPLRAAVTDEIRSRIVRGQLKPGDRLLEEDLAAELGVSRNPVRESFQALALEGFVRIEPRRGAYVDFVDSQRAHELFEVRLPLEGLVAELAAKRRSPSQLAGLVQMVKEARGFIAVDQLERLPEMNTRFHDNLAAAAHNALLASTLHRLSHVVQWVYAARIRERSANSWGEHEALVDAIAQQDAELARELSEAHVAAARLAFLGSDGAAD